MVISDIKSFVKHDDRILKTREIIKCSKADGLIAKLGAYKGDELYNNLVKEAKIPEIDAKILQSSIEDVVCFNNSSNINFDDFSENIYKLSKNIFKKNESREPIIMIINHVQKPNSDSANVGAIGTVGLSSIKLASDILNDRMLNFTVPIGYVDSNMVILANAGGNFYNKKTSYPIELFTKVNLGFGKLKTSDGDRKISNYGFLVGGDFGLLENKMKIGTSVMFDYSNLNGLYRNSNIKSIVVSLYSKNNIFELKKRYFIGIFI